MRTKTIKIDDDVMAELRLMTMDGNVATLPRQLDDRKLYERIDKALKALGGKWNRKVGGHVFGEDPRPLLGQATEAGEVVDLKKSLGQFFTPPDIASWLVDEATLWADNLVLEPSCGDGRIVRALLKDQSRPTVYGVEIDPKLYAKTAAEFGGNRFSGECRDFLTMDPSTIQPFDRVVMNPPFNGGADMEHVAHALRFLKPGGYLTAIIANGPRQRDYFHREQKRQDVAWLMDLPEGTFKAEGTNVSAAMMLLRRPLGAKVLAYAPPRPMADRAVKPLPSLPLLELLCR